MKAHWHDIWGSAQGKISRLGPQIRILVGLCTFFASLITNGASLCGTSFIVLTTVGWHLVCRPPAKIWRTMLGLGFILFLPYFFLTPFVKSTSDTAIWISRLAITWNVIIHGLSGLLITTTTIATLTLSDLREGLSRLPVPRLVSSILIQIIHQTATILYETRVIASAMAVRGATHGGLTAWRVFYSLPQVWLPRIIQRAERVAAAMELRQYAGSVGLIRQRKITLTWTDGLALGLGTGWLALAIIARLWRWL